jgi:glycosyltransferase involved in cell wall biosynthesis
MHTGKKKILLFSDWYEPGFKAGGPIRSAVNFTRHMEDEYEIYVFTSDRDLGSAAPYAQIRADAWTAQGKNSFVYYCSPGHLTLKNIRSQIFAIDPDLIYLNSMFSRYFSIYPLLIEKWNKKKFKVVLAPRGMLRKTALRFKPLKKKVFLSALRKTGLADNLYFHAVDETELLDIQRSFGAAAKVSLIPNFPGAAGEPPAAIKKIPGRLSALFAGRIHPIKGLDFLLRMISRLEFDFNLMIAGSLEDKKYWEKCEGLIRGLPEKVKVEYIGEIPNPELVRIMADQHIFILPTQGENFGHAIYEALSLGRPALISDQTPWKGLIKKKAGWDLPLDREDLFIEALRQSAAFDQADYDGWSQGAWTFAEEFREKSDLKMAYKKLFS